jgi:hypothetical protein
MIRQIDTSIQEFILTLSKNFNLDKDEIYSLWSGKKNDNINNINNNKSISSIDTTDFSPERLSKSTVAELKALCKTKGVKCTGKKDELVSRLLNKEENTQSEYKTKPPPKKEKKENVVIKNLAPMIPTIAIRRNAFGNLIHPETQLVFDRINETVIGKQSDDGKVNCLTDEDIQTCKRHKFKYVLPNNLDKGMDVKNVKVEGLEEDEENEKEENEKEEIEDEEGEEIEDEEDEDIDID